MGERMAGNDILSRVQILLDADTARFSEGMQDAQGQSASTFDSIRSNANKMGLAVVAGATTAIVALGGMALETANQAAELERMAFRANTTTQEFQKMAVGAQAYGIEQDQLSDMLKDFNEKLGELTTIGAGGGVDFFEQIATKTEGSAKGAEKLILQMQKLSGPEALQLYVDKLEEAGVTQQQMSFYLESMASDLTDMIPLLANGGEGMQLYADAASRAGVIMSDETITQAKILKEQVYLLDLQLQGAKNQLMAAVIPAFVDIASAFFSGSEQGLQFSGVADGIAIGLKFIAKVAIGAATSVQLVGKALGGLAAAGAALASGEFEQAKAIGSTMLADLKETALSTADRMDAISKGTTSGVATQMASLKKVETQVSGVNSGLGELTKKQEGASAAAAKHSQAADKLNNDLERLREQQKRNREQITKLYAHDFQNIVWDEADELDRIRNANFNAENQAKYLALAQKSFLARNAEYFKSLNIELNQHKWTELEKLAYSYKMDREIAENDVKLADEVREAKLKAIDEVHIKNVNAAKLARDKRIFESNQAFMTESEIMIKHYELERREIQETILDLEERNAAMSASYHNEDRDNDSSRRDVWNNFRSDQGGFEDANVGLEVELENRNLNIQAALEWQLITQEDYQRRLLQSEQQYHFDRVNLSLTTYENTFGATANFFKAMLGESSAAYRTLYFTQQAFALSQAGMNVYKAASDAYANEPGTWYQKAGAAAIATIESGTFVAMLQAATPQGFATGGYVQGPGSTTSDSILAYLSDQEYVTKASSVKSVGVPAMDYINRTGRLPVAQSSGGDINITVHVTDSGVSTQSSQSDQKQLGQMIGNAVRAVIMQEKRQGGLLSK